MRQWWSSHYTVMIILKGSVELGLFNFFILQSSLFYLLYMAACKELANLHFWAHISDFYSHLFSSWTFVGCEGKTCIWLCKSLCTWVWWCIFMIIKKCFEMTLFLGNWHFFGVWLLDADFFWIIQQWELVPNNRKIICKRNKYIVLDEYCSELLLFLIHSCFMERRWGFNNVFLFSPYIYTWQN